MSGEEIDVYLGEARFTSPRSVEVDGQEIRGRRFLIAIGAGPVVPPISGLESVGFLIYKTFWDLEELPGRLLVISGGAVGCGIGPGGGAAGGQGHGVGNTRPVCCRERNRRLRSCCGNR